MRVVNKMLDNNCSRCGECCGAMPMPITRKEEKIIRAYIKKHNIPYRPSEIWKNGDECNEILRCPFYNRDKHCCDIYEVRPEMCRNFRCNMTQEELQKNLETLHTKAYWNKIDSKGCHHLTNFAKLFYNRDVDLYKWFVSNLQTELNIERTLAAAKALEMMQDCGIVITQEFLNKLANEMREDNERFNNL